MTLRIHNQSPNPPFLGDFLKLGGHPQTPGRNYPAPLRIATLRLPRYARNDIENSRAIPQFPILGGLFETGGTPPDPWQEASCTSFLAASHLSSAGNLNLTKAAEIVSINPLIPQSWGTFYSWGTPPDPWQEASCVSFSAVSIH